MDLDFTPFNIGLVAMILFTLKMLAMLFLGFDDDGDFESDGIYTLFSINKILSFFMGFGFAQHELRSFFISIPIGLLFSLLYHFVMGRVRKLSNTTDVETVYPKQDDLVKTYNRVDNKGGVIMWKGREFEAIANDNISHAPHKIVKVKNVINATVYVEELQQT